MTKTLLTIGLIILCCLSAIGQNNLPKDTLDYPASIVLDKEYSFSITADSIKQKVVIRATGNKEIWYRITVTKKMTGIVGGKYTEYYSGVAKLDLTRFVGTDKGYYNYSWHYKTTDNLLIITLLNGKTLKLSLEIAKLEESIMDFTE